MVDITVVIPNTAVKNLRDYVINSKSPLNRDISPSEDRESLIVDVGGATYSFTKLKLKVTDYFVDRGLCVRFGDSYRSLETGDVVGSVGRKRGSRFSKLKTDGSFERFESSKLTKETRLLLNRVIDLSEVGFKDKKDINTSRVVDVKKVVCVLEALLNKFPFHKGSKNSAGGHFYQSTAEAASLIVNEQKPSRSGYLINHWLDSVNVDDANDTYSFDCVNKRVQSDPYLRDGYKQAFKEISEKGFCEQDEVESLAVAIEASLAGGAFQHRKQDLFKGDGFNGFDGEKCSGTGEYLGCDVLLPMSSSHSNNYTYIMHLRGDNGELIDVKSSSCFSKSEMIEAYKNKLSFNYIGGDVTHRKGTSFSRVKIISIPDRTEVKVKPSMVKLICNNEKRDLHLASPRLSI
ncbi:hypothetical protein [Photobacterium kishitanii]|uniref:Uncharacterized protein n=1 Tax=Photobacterium kishitanii TaxID=318456 RepID=A0A2T3KMX5_9GAMM|nr:hypothetical protein [Photobacterium kishitanii]PSV01153.1 hypothetical protein C9J27_03780 [Photobacterium kishitanii]